MVNAPVLAAVEPMAVGDASLETTYAVVATCVLFVPVVEVGVASPRGILQPVFEQTTFAPPLANGSVSVPPPAVDVVRPLPFTSVKSKPAPAPRPKKSPCASLIPTAP